MALALVAAPMRSRNPLEDSDLPFLLTCTSVLVIALLPPPAVALLGPLCQAVDGWQASERMVRALCFSSLYTIHVYSMTIGGGGGETVIVVARSAAAAVWVTGASAYWLPLAILQGSIVILTRLKEANRTSYVELKTEDENGAADEEAGSFNGHAESVVPLSPTHTHEVGLPAAVSALPRPATPLSHAEIAQGPHDITHDEVQAVVSMQTPAQPTFGALSFREVVPPVPTATNCATVASSQQSGGGWTAAQLAAIAAASCDERSNDTGVA